MKVGFEVVVHSMPAETLNVREHFAYLEPAVAALCKADRDRLRRTSPRQVRRLKDVSAAEIMALEAGQKALGRAGLVSADVDGLLVAQTGGKQCMPLLASYVHLNLGLGQSVVARNIEDGNVSILNACYMASSMLQSGWCRRVLVVAVASQIGGETAFGVDLTEPLAQNFGDGSAAAIVSSGNLEWEFLAHHVEIHPVRSRPVDTIAGVTGRWGAVRSLANPDLAIRAGMQHERGAYLVLEDAFLEGIAGQKGYITESLRRALSRAGLDLVDLDIVIVPHMGQLEARWREDLRKAGVKWDALVNVREKYGNLAVAEPLVNLAELAKNGRITPGSVVALWIPCPGVRLAVLVLRYVGRGSDG